MQKFGKENFNEGNAWRLKCIEQLSTYKSVYKVVITNPNDYFSFKDTTPLNKSEREVMEFDLNRVRNSDLIIVNFNDPKSLGTMAEIAIAYDRRIPIVGLNAYTYDLYPWQKEFCNRIFDNINEMLDYIKSFYLS